MLVYLTENDIPDSLKDIADEIGMDNFIKLYRLCSGFCIYSYRKFSYKAY